ncbi:dienelactone hydrolase family protein [Flavisolibacter ginsengisoli]|jgi:dienelactone hydrolase|uniref:Dienelactone hydrolase n=1 Tax=Flavisolibacter ginsengisoli DSM 18119 TaxID=1121884 RepID=A0A1M4UNL4_9BACT|nr:dienelactone hydrolase family protein [Flavisolibacter ginsengisoli]SHE58372.1 Dienelactone hydrolase [Flavisolibacter ginsengisoli DSM 18119]
MSVYILSDFMDTYDKITISIPLENVELKGDMALPANAHALVVFAHGSGSSRLSPRNQLVATYLNSIGLGTLLFDLLTYEEDKNYSTRFDINLLADRLLKATLWVEGQNWGKNVQIGYFGASTGAAAALVAASKLSQVLAVVSRGGRPDLAFSALPKVKAATLLIVGSLDSQVLQLNKQAYNQLSTEKKLEVVAGASHLFEEEGTMDQVCLLAGNWFEKHLQPIPLLND